MKQLFIWTVLWMQTEIPFKPEGEFQVNVEMKFKSKPAEHSETYDASGQRMDKRGGELVAFFGVNIVDLKIQTNEIKIIAVDSHGKTLLKKKALPVANLHFDFGFVDVLKAGSAANEITVYFLSDEKKELSKIVMTVTSNGDFLVNGKWHGHF